MHIVASSINASSRSRHHLLALATLAVLFTALCLYALVVDNYTQWDAVLSNWVHARQDKTLDVVMLAITMTADLPVSTTLIAAFVVVLMIDRHWWLSCYLVCAFFSTTLSVTIIKSLTQRSRPALSESALSLMSFPSGHAARAVLVFGALALLLSWGRSASIRSIALLIAAISGALVATSRVYLGVHWTSDVLAGVVLAAIMLVGFDWQLRRHDEHNIQLPTGVVLATLAVTVSVYCFYNFNTQASVYAIAG